VVTVLGVSHPRDLTDDPWELLEPVFNPPRKRGHKHADDRRAVVDACCASRRQAAKRYLPRSLGAKDTGLVPVPPLVTQRRGSARFRRCMSLP
jgi:transposase